MGIQCLLFDLDGTLADTAPDMVAALNRVLDEEGLPALPRARARDHVSHGSAALVRLAFGDAQSGQDFTRRKASFLTHYASRICAETRLFPGMEAVLDTVEANGCNWGVVTNKPGWLTDPLMEALNLNRRAACIISGDTTAERKPHPLPMRTAARLAGKPSSACLYLGDAERDIQAGKAAGMRTLIAGYGYIDATQQPERWGADGTIQHPGEILEWISRRLDNV